MRLGSRLAIAFGVLAIVVASLVSLAGLRATSTELDSSIDGFLVARAAELTDGIRQRPGAGQGRRQPPIRLDGITQRFTTDADSIVQTVLADGTIVNQGTALPVTDEVLRLARRDGRNQPSDRRFDDVEVDGEPHRMVTSPLPEGGVVQVARSTAENRSVLTSLGGRLALIAAVTTLVAGLVGWLVARRITRPLRRLSGVAAGVAETRDFSTPVPVVGSDEVGQLAASLREMLDALEQSRAQQQRLVHDAGHELRTPLTSLRANVAMLERAPDLPAAERAEIVRALRAELIELSELFDEMIDLAGDQYSTELTFEPVLLENLARRLAERWARRSGRPIEVAADDSLVRGDVGMLDRALSNLLSNAHKFSPPGAPIEIVVEGGRMAVRDHGDGVPLADRRRVFDRFHRTEATRSMPGSGLGLAIVAQIVARHGGDVFVGDAPSGGAEIGFQLPLADDVGPASTVSSGTVPSSTVPSSTVSSGTVSSSAVSSSSTGTASPSVDESLHSVTVEE
ncbi:MAG: ATP-binding protein [Actinomycetota bacterium]